MEINRGYVDSFDFYGTWAYNFKNPGLSFVGEKAVEGVDVIAGHVMGTKAAEETSMAVKTLHRALISPNETSSGFFSNHDVISPHEEASSEPKAWNVSDISPLSYPVLGMAEPRGSNGVGP